MACSDLLQNAATRMHVLVPTDNTATVAYNVVRKEIVFWNVTVQNYSDTGLNILE